MLTVVGIEPLPGGETVHPDPMEELEFVWLATLGAYPIAVTRPHGPPGTPLADLLAMPLAVANETPADPPLEPIPARAKYARTTTTTTTATRTGQNLRRKGRWGGGTIELKDAGGADSGVTGTVG
jgi:hypothetical protein